MPRIFKGSESTLRLLISKTGDYQALTEIKIKLYTTDIENAIEIIDGIQVCKNIAIITLAPRAFMGMEDGLINYIIDGATEDDVFHTERQSNYMLKSLSYINEDGVASQTMTIESNGEYRVTPNDGLYVDINVNVPDLNGSYDEGYEQGKTDGVNEQKSKLESINITENGTYTKEDGYNEIVVEVPDLNGSYDEGYGQGKTDGVNEQKSKLESINITENGTYTKEDGYNQIEVNVPDLNGSYDEGHRDGEQAGYNSGYTQGQADVAANARVLNVTENGNYLSKFSEPANPTLVTGVYADGTEFYNYAELNGAVYNTKIKATKDSRLEFWFKGKNTTTEKRYDVIINANGESSVIIQYYGNNNTIIIFFGSGGLPISNWDNTSWHHLIISRTEGFWIDGEHMDYSANDEVFGGEFFINGDSGDNNKNANGYFGMIKIDDVVIIPTANGFQNVNTGELLEVVKDGEYTYTENPPKYGEGELYKTINVNVPPKINVQKAGLKLGFSSFKEIPEWVDFEDITNMTYMFMNCTNLQTIPLIDTSYVTDMQQMFNNCSSLQTIPLLNTSSVTNMEQMFSQCGKLKTIPSLDTSKVTNMYSMFWSCYNLTSIPALNAQSLNMPSYYGVFGYSELSKLTDFGGLLNLKCSLTNDNNLKKLPNLTYESCINILNGLYDFTGNGETPGSNQGQLKVHQNFLDKVGDEISIGTAKGWQITV